jgi:TPP-dependent pyruvate/acetoin dehydrogenase alpha subunit
MLPDVELSVAEKIIRLRAVQMAINERCKVKAFKVPIHLALGHEAIAVALSETRLGQDGLFLTHRNIHHNLAQSSNARRVVEEFLLSADGLASGRLGSMNLANQRRSVIYTSSILANNLSVATGYALGERVGQTNGMVYVVTGDGAIEEGTFWESLVFMKSQGLSVIIIVENNRWSLGSEINQRRCELDLDLFAKSLSIKYVSLDGNDVFEYIDILHGCRREAINRAEPVLVEVNLVTLGSWLKQGSGLDGSKFINYHAGPAPTVGLTSYPLIDESTHDPLFVLEGRFPNSELVARASRIVGEVEEELS